MPELAQCSGTRYLTDSRLERASIPGWQKPVINRVEPFKRYPLAEKVPLPRSWKLEEEHLLPLLQHRRSTRAYASKPLSLEQLSFLLWASQGITGQAGKYLFRTTPSAGALYPVETYLSINTVQGLAAGLYHFDVQHFTLERLSGQNMAGHVAHACVEQKFMAQAPVVFLWTAVLRRTMSKYGNRGMRYILLDAGHICQNVLTAAAAVGCAGCPVAAFYDDELNHLLDIDGIEESAIYAASVGPRATISG